MMMKTLIQFTGSIIEIAGIVIIAGGALYSIIRALKNAFRKGERESFDAFRRNLGMAILLGLEFLVAGDIIRTVAVEATFRSVGVLAAIVGIRTFLSFSLEVEMTGRLPWAKFREKVD